MLFLLNSQLAGSYTWSICDGFILYFSFEQFNLYITDHKICITFPLSYHTTAPSNKSKSYTWFFFYILQSASGVRIPCNKNVIIVIVFKLCSLIGWKNINSVFGQWAGRICLRLGTIRYNVRSHHKLINHNQLQRWKLRVYVFDCCNMNIQGYK